MNERLPFQKKLTVCVLTMLDVTGKHHASESGVGVMSGQLCPPVWCSSGLNDLRPLSSYIGSKIATCMSRGIMVFFPEKNTRGDKGPVSFVAMAVSREDSDSDSTDGYPDSRAKNATT